MNYALPLPFLVAMLVKIAASYGYKIFIRPFTRAAWSAFFIAITFITDD